MSNANQLPSILVISEDREMVEALLQNGSNKYTLQARDTVQLVLDNPNLLDTNSVCIFDISSNENVATSIDRILALKALDPTQVVMLVGHQDQLGEVLRSSVQPVIYRAFTKPISVNQVSLAFASAVTTHQKLVEDQASGVDISLIGSAENHTNVDSIAKERSNTSLIFGAIGLVLIAGAFILSFTTSEDEPVTDQAIAPPLSSAELLEEPELVVSASAQKIQDLHEKAQLAVTEKRLISPQGDNALEYFNQVLAIDSYDGKAYRGKKKIAANLRDSYNTLVAGAEFDQALEVINVLQSIDPLNLDNDLLRDGLEKAIEVHVNRVKKSGTSEEVAATTAVLARIESDFAGSKSANEALQNEKKLVALIDQSLDANVLIPPKRNNAYALVSEALKNNSVSNANLSPRVAALSTKLLNLASASLNGGDVDEAGTIAALAKRLDVNKDQLSRLNKDISNKKREIEEKQKAEKELADNQGEEGASEAADSPAAPKIIPAKIISRTPPRYPSRALTNEIEGWVEVEFSIDQRGRPVDIKISKSEPPRVFDSAAIRAVEKWRFSPARSEETGLAVLSDNIQTKVQFRLN